ncbi:MAG: hypothetical protein M1827_001547 [Pycnora praestabilis]|nr:MAG: hypothetical protein M1827_001547 [Pycnora praestabilis]
MVNSKTLELRDTNSQLKGKTQEPSDQSYLHQMLHALQKFAVRKVTMYMPFVGRYNAVSKYFTSKPATSDSGYDSSESPPESPGDSKHPQTQQAEYHLPVRVSSAGPPSNPFEVQQRLVEWEYSWFGSVEPKWRIKPDIEIIKEVVRPYLGLCGFGKEEITVERFAGGAFNELFTITSAARRECIFRVALGVDPYYKVESDVATTEYVRLHAPIPVPQIYAFDSSTDNKLGMEWILMEKMQGVTVRNLFGINWDDSQWEMKIALSRQIADWMDQLSRLRFSKIGSLYINWDLSTPGKLVFFLGRVVDYEFCKAHRIGYDIYRGPFNSTQEYRYTTLDFISQDANDPCHKERIEKLEKENLAKKLAKDTLAKGNQHLTNEGKEKGEAAVDEGEEEDSDEDEDNQWTAEDLEDIPKACDALRPVVPRLYPEESPDAPSMILYHFDVSVMNVLVDSSGKGIGLVDWELVITSPAVLNKIYPPVINAEFDLPDGAKLSPWGGSASSLEVWHSNKHEHTVTKLRRIFYARLLELKSPWLEVRHERHFVEKNEKSAERLFSETIGGMSWGAKAYISNVPLIEKELDHRDYMKKKAEERLQRREAKKAAAAASRD